MLLYEPAYRPCSAQKRLCLGIHRRRETWSFGSAPSLFLEMGPPREFTPIVYNTFAGLALDYCERARWPGNLLGSSDPSVEDTF